MNRDTQQLHKVRGSVEVAIDLIDRAAMGYAGFRDDEQVLANLAEAASALACVASALGAKLERVSV